MGYLRDGTWTDSETWPTDDAGRFIRDAARFRLADEHGDVPPFAAEPGRYRLVLAHACPWCHRTAIARSLAGLTERIPVTYVDPVMREGGWRFPEAARRDPAGFGASYVHELYTRTAPTYSGRVTVPILWDVPTARIVCNESADLVRMFDQAGAAEHGRPRLIDDEASRALGERIYHRVNNGVYRCGFARSQAAYEEAFHALFDELDALSARFADGRRFLLGDTLAVVDVWLFPTLVRFDAVYHGHFKCNRDRIADIAPLQAYLERLWAIEAFRETTRLDEIKTHYYASHRNLNPSGIVPVGPRLAFTAPGASSGQPLSIEDQPNLVVVTESTQHVEG